MKDLFGAEIASPHGTSVPFCARPRRATQMSGGTNPQVCGTLAARDGFKTGPRTPNGQDAYDGKLIVASFDPYEPGGVKTVRQDGAACTVVNGTCAGWHGAIIQDVRRRPQTSADAADLLTGRQVTATLIAGYWKGPGNTQDNSLVVQFPRRESRRVQTAVGGSDVSPTIVASLANATVGNTQDACLLLQRVQAEEGGASE